MYYFSKIVVLLIAISILFFGCTSTNAIYSEKKTNNENENSKNNVVEYKEPQYKTSRNAIFLGTVLLGGAGGALAGYLNPTEKVIGKGKYKDAYGVWHDDGTEKEYTYTTLIGAGAGLIVTYYLAKWLTPNSGAYQISANQEQKWLDDINNEMRINSIIVNKYKNSSDTISNMFLIPKSSENNFKMDNLNDAFLYTSAFPNSKYAGNLLTNSFHNFHREELPKLIDYFKSDPSTEKVKLHYLNTGSGFNDYINAYKRYPSLKNEAERKAAASASNINEYKNYLAKFSNGASTAEIKQKLEIAERKLEEKLRIAREKAEVEERIKAEKAEKARAEWEKEKQRLYNSYSPAERDKLALEISTVKNKMELLKSERDRLREESRSLQKESRNITLHQVQNNERMRKLKSDLFRKQAKKGYEADNKQKEYEKYYNKLRDLYDKAPWLR